MKRSLIFNEPKVVGLAFGPKGTKSQKTRTSRRGRGRGRKKFTVLWLIRALNESWHPYLRASSLKSSYIVTVMYAIIKSIETCVWLHVYPCVRVSSSVCCIVPCVGTCRLAARPLTAADCKRKRRPVRGTSLLEICHVTYTTCGPVCVVGMWYVSFYNCTGFLFLCFIPHTPRYSEKNENKGKEKSF